jgi:hypothetical protein
VDDEVQQLPEGLEDDEAQHLRELLAAYHRILPNIAGKRR